MSSAGAPAGRSWASISGAPGLPANQRLILKHSRTRYLRAANSVSPTKKSVKPELMSAGLTGALFSCF